MKHIAKLLVACLALVAPSLALAQARVKSETMKVTAPVTQKVDKKADKKTESVKVTARKDDLNSAVKVQTPIKSDKAVKTSPTVKTKKQPVVKEAKQGAIKKKALKK